MERYKAQPSWSTRQRSGQEGGVGCAHDGVEAGDPGASGRGNARDGNPNEASAGESSEKIPEKRRGDEGADKAVYEQV